MLKDPNSTLVLGMFLGAFTISAPAFMPIWLAALICLPLGVYIAHKISEAKE